MRGNKRKITIELAELVKNSIIITTKPTAIPAKKERNSFFSEKYPSNFLNENHMIKRVTTMLDIITPFTIAVFTRNGGLSINKAFSQSI